MQFESPLPSFKEPRTRPHPVSWIQITPALSFRD